MPQNYGPNWYVSGENQLSTDDWGGAQEGDIAAIGQGKGKGTQVFSGRCSTCGVIGHKAASCPSSGKHGSKESDTSASSLDTAPGIARSRRKETGTGESKDKEERDH